MGSTVTTDDLSYVLLDRDGAEKYRDSLITLLQSCVNDDPPASSIGFLAPLRDTAADAYWTAVFNDLAAPNAPTLLVVPDGNDPNSVVATVQIARYAKETHAHKGEIRKLLVHPSRRRGGFGRRLMDVVERIAREDLGIGMLLLDTARDTPARQFYQRLGWTEWGMCPEYARFADGGMSDCSFFYKRL